MSALKILIADDEIHRAQGLSKSLQDNGFESYYVSRGSAALDGVQKDKPDFLIIDLLLPERNALECLKEMKSRGILNLPTKVIVTSGHSSPSNVRECLRFGASDYLVKPFTDSDLLDKLAFHSQPTRIAADTDAHTLTESLSNNLGLVERMIKVASNPHSDLHSILYRLSAMAAMIFPSGRCNFIEASLETGKCSVKAASDDANLRDLKIELSRYPEVVHCLNTEKTIALENLSSDKVMSQLKKAFKNVHFNSMIVAPVHVLGKIEGVFSVRLNESHPGISEAEIQMTRVIADLAGLAWSSAK